MLKTAVNVTSQVTPTQKALALSTINVDSYIFFSSVEDKRQESDDDETPEKKRRLEKCESDSEENTPVSSSRTSSSETATVSKRERDNSTPAKCTSSRAESKSKTSEDLCSVTSLSNSFGLCARAPICFSRMLPYPLMRSSFSPYPTQHPGASVGLYPLHVTPMRPGFSHVPASWKYPLWTYKKPQIVGSSWHPACDNLWLIAHANS